MGYWKPIDLISAPYGKWVWYIPDGTHFKCPEGLYMSKVNKDNKIEIF
jgi:hypothetical protein